MSDPVLEIENLDVSYGSSQALFGVSLSVPAGSVLAVLGANGAGKSTLAAHGVGTGTAGRRARALRGS